MRSKDGIEHRIWACALLLPLALLLSQGCSSTPPEPATESEAPPASSGIESGGNRRIFGGCSPATEVKRYEGLVGKKVLVTFAWENTKMSEETANLKVPAKVLRIDFPYVTVNFDRKVPNLELYTSVWIYSGHIRAQPDGAFGVDPCSATFVEGSW